LLFYDKEMNLTDSLIFSFREANPVVGMAFAYDNFSIYKGNMYFRQKLNDTIFQIDRTNSITPHLVVDLGGLKMPSLLVPSVEWRSKYFRISNLYIINNYYFIMMNGRLRIPRPGSSGFEHLVYNRTSGETYFLAKHPDPYQEEYQNSSMPINDMDGMSDPSILWYQKNGKCIYYLDIVDAKTYLESGAIDTDKLVTDKYYNELSKLLAESDIEDNPIIRILHLK